MGVGYSSIWGHTEFRKLLKNVVSDYNKYIYVSDIFNYETDTMEDLDDLPGIIHSDRYYYHGTNPCSAIKIYKEGFKNNADGSKFTGGMLGEGIYFADNLEKSVAYGSVIFIVELRLKNPMIISDISKLKTTPPDNDGIIYRGTFDRHGVLQRPESERTDSFFNEYCVFDANNIKIKKIIYVNHVLKHGKPISSTAFPRCIYDCITGRYIAGDTTNDEFELTISRSDLFKNNFYFCILDFRTVLESRFVSQTGGAQYPFDNYLNGVRKRDMMGTLYPVKSYMGLYRNLKHDTFLLYGFIFAVTFHLNEKMIGKDTIYDDLKGSGIEYRDDGEILNFYDSKNLMIKPHFMFTN